jgi:hypothetical protein
MRTTPRSHRNCAACATAIVIGLFLSHPQLASAQEPATYQLAEGKTMGYVLTIEITTATSSEYIGGVAFFWGRPGNDKVMTTKSRDNLVKSKSASAIRATFPTGNKMLKENFIVNQYGEPLTGLNGKLPMLLGDFEELFCPPLPKKGKVRSTTYNNVYHFGDGQFRFYGSPPVDEEQKGKFTWSTTHVRTTGHVLHYVHRRKFATKDGQYQLVAQGPIEFDAGTGRLISHKLKGFCVYDGKPANFSIKVAKLSRNQMTQLVAVKK